MNERVAVALYSAAVVAMPISVAVKFFLGLNGWIWVDPTLVLSVAALLMLLPRWGEFLTGELRIVTFGTAAIAVLSLVCAFSGFLLRPTDSLYGVLREPLRLWLNLCWLILSSWFLLHGPRVVLRSSTIAVGFALSSGILLYLAAIGVVPAPQSVLSYTRIYLLRQTIWIAGLPMPRMGGLFFESPPFGLFMFAMLAVSSAMHNSGFRTAWTTWGFVLAAFGMLLSFADQVLLGAFLSLVLCFPLLSRKQPRLAWIVLLLAMVALGAFEVASIAHKQMTSGPEIAMDINGSSIGERSFHFHYGLALFQDHPAAALLGFGPGRYGEYVVETGNYPDTVTMQTSEPEILVEWGTIGVLIWVVLLGCVTGRVWRVHRMLGISLLLGLIVADSFQANWKYEGVFLAIAALCASRPVSTLERSDGRILLQPATDQVI